MRVLKDDTVAIVIDVQERLHRAMSNKEQLANNLVILIKGLKCLGVPILVTQQYTKGLGPTIPPVHEALGSYSIIEKISFSCCDEPSFMKSFSQLKRKWVIITGIESHVCILQTVIDLLENDYNPVLVEDCVSSRGENDKRIAVERMKSAGAVISTYESVLFELCRYAGTDTFKEISQLVK